MKKMILWSLATALGLGMFSAVAQDPAAAAAPASDKAKSTVTLNDDNEKFSYAIGMQIGKSLQRLQSSLKLDLFNAGIQDVLGDKEPALTEAQVREIMMSMSAKMEKEEQEKGLSEAKKYLEENGKKEGVVTLPSGLQYKVIKEGTGPKPKATDTVSVHYKGTFIDGKTFDSSYDRNEPATFKLNQVIPGWTEAVQLMGVGSKWQLVIPPDLAYGEKGQRTIPPNSLLIFEVELLEIKAEGGDEVVVPSPAAK